MKKFWRQGEPFVWATGLALSLILFFTALLLWVVVKNGVAVFWPTEVALATLTSGEQVMGEVYGREAAGRDGYRLQFKIGNRDLYGLDFRWLDEAKIAALAYPAAAYVLERQEYGNFYGFLRDLGIANLPVAAGLGPDEKFVAALRLLHDRKEELAANAARINRHNNSMEKVQMKLAKLRYQGAGEQDPRVLALLAEQQSRRREFDAVVQGDNDLRQELAENYAVFADAAGVEKQISLIDIVRQYQPNRLSFFAKTGHYLGKLGELFFDEPRESNTEGGLFPAIFGTVMLVFIMSILSFPLGVIAGIYLREYAREGLLVRLVRIAVNNLAGIPSIVYGIFGLGFFVYGIGGNIDRLFFPERLPAATFGTGGILWASLTLGLLTIPVVIVATEEALGSIPPGIREGSLSLAATKYQTLRNLLLPMASPGIMTGFILAMARAAGEVAPLMITGVVKLAPALPVDGNFPFLHLNRKFMHLGFHIYDIGFQSPNVEAAKPMVYVTTLLLIAIVLLMCSAAIHLRNKMRRRYAISDM